MSSGARPRYLGVAGVQMAVAAGRDNSERIAAHVQHIKQRYPWVDVIVFPELAVFGPSPAHAQPLPGIVEAQFCEIARSAKVWLVPGSLFESDGQLIYNTAPIIGPDGVVVARYRKMFPFQPYEQDVAAGADFVVFEIPGVCRIGLSICYDMWFPETTRTLATMGAEIILHPTMTDTIDRDVELAIARASAATNQCYFFDINGVSGGGVGQSIIVDPSGYVLHRSGYAEETVPIRVDLERVREERRSGMRGLGQPLKSFRDRTVDFAVYDRARGSNTYLDSLGPVEKPASEISDQLSKKRPREQTPCRQQK